MSRKSLNEKKMYGKSEKWLNITWNPLNLHQITASKLFLSAISTNHKLNCMYCFALFRLVSFGPIHVYTYMYDRFCILSTLFTVLTQDVMIYYAWSLIRRTALSPAGTHWSSDSQRPFSKQRKHSRNDLNNKSIRFVWSELTC